MFGAWKGRTVKRVPVVLVGLAIGVARCPVSGANAIELTIEIQKLGLAIKEILCR